jgi:hypothetical protein
MTPAIANRSTADTMTIRLDRKLKDEFISAAKTEDRPASEVLRDLMLAYVEDRERKLFEAEAQRESRLVAAAFDGEEVDLLFEETWNLPGWK